MPLRWMVVPKVPVVERPKRDSTGPATGHGSSPWNGRSGRSTVAASPGIPDRVDCSRWRACSSSPTYSAASSRRRSSSSSIRVRSATAPGRRRLEVDGLGAQPRHLPLFGFQLGARRLLLVEQPPVLGDADLLDSGQRHHAAAGAGQVALVAGVEQQPDITVAATLVERLQPFLERRRALDPLALERLHAGRGGLHLGGHRGEPGIDRGQFLGAQRPGQLELAQRRQRRRRLPRQLVGLALECGDALAGAPDQARGRPRRCAVGAGPRPAVRRLAAVAGAEQRDEQPAAAADERGR